MPVPAPGGQFKCPATLTQVHHQSHHHRKESYIIISVRYSSMPWLQVVGSLSQLTGADGATSRGEVGIYQYTASTTSPCTWPTAWNDAREKVYASIAACLCHKLMQARALLHSAAQVPATGDQTGMTGRAAFNFSFFSFPSYPAIRLVPRLGRGWCASPMS